eukprot:2497-Heterococcus_DN1.PRE.2
MHTNYKPYQLHSPWHHAAVQPVLSLLLAVILLEYLQCVVDLSHKFSALHSADDKHYSTLSNWQCMRELASLFAVYLPSDA